MGEWNVFGNTQPQGWYIHRDSKYSKFLKEGSIYSKCKHFLLLEGWSERNILYPGYSKRMSLVGVSRLRNVSERQVISKLWTKLEAVRRDNLV